MKTIYSIVIWMCLIVLCGECEDTTRFIVSKVIAGILLLVFVKLLEKSMTDDEINEEV